MQVEDPPRAVTAAALGDRNWRENPEPGPQHVQTPALYMKL